MRYFQKPCEIELQMRRLFGGAEEKDREANKDGRAHDHPCSWCYILLLQVDASLFCRISNVIDKYFCKICIGTKSFKYSIHFKTFFCEY